MLLRPRPRLLAARPFAARLGAAALGVAGVAEVDPELPRDRAHFLHLVGEDEADPGAGPPGAAGAADPVDVGGPVLGRVVVDDSDHVGDVDAAGGDVGGDQRPHFTALEAGERRLALAL